MQNLSRAGCWQTRGAGGGRRGVRGGGAEAFCWQLHIAVCTSMHVMIGTPTMSRHHYFCSFSQPLIHTEEQLQLNNPAQQKSLHDCGNFTTGHNNRCIITADRKLCIKAWMGYPTPGIQSLHHQPPPQPSSPSRRDFYLETSKLRGQAI